MADLPHHYRVAASAHTEGLVALTSDPLPALTSAPPAEFGGPGDQWSPEHLLVAAVADCFILTFKAIARASNVDWTSLSCEAEGTLDRVERVTRFTGFHLTAALTAPAGTDEGRAQRLLEKAEAACLITNSLAADVHLETRIVIEG